MTAISKSFQSLELFIIDISSYKLLPWTESANSNNLKINSIPLLSTVFQSKNGKHNFQLDS